MGNHPTHNNLESRDSRGVNEYLYLVGHSTLRTSLSGTGEMKCRISEKIILSALSTLFGNNRISSYFEPAAHLLTS